MNKRLKKKQESKTERKENEMQNYENLIPDDGIDRSVYEEPYIIKEGCLCEEVMTKNGTAYIKLCDYVPVLISEVTFDDGTEQKNHSQSNPGDQLCRLPLQNVPARVRRTLHLHATSCLVIPNGEAAVRLPLPVSLFSAVTGLP